MCFAEISTGCTSRTSDGAAGELTATGLAENCERLTTSQVCSDGKADVLELVGSRFSDLPITSLHRVETMVVHHKSNQVP